MNDAPQNANGQGGTDKAMASTVIWQEFIDAHQQAAKAMEHLADAQQRFAELHMTVPSPHSLPTLLKLVESCESLRAHSQAYFAMAQHLQEVDDECNQSNADQQRAHEEQDVDVPASSTSTAQPDVPSTPRRSTRLAAKEAKN